MGEVAEKENELTLTIKRAPGRRSLAAPMNKLIRRLSGMPSESKTPEQSLKTRLSFQSWKRRKSFDRERKKEESDNEKKREPLVLPNLISSIGAGHTRPREILKRAPIAQAEQVLLPIAKKSRVIVAVARRLSAFSARPIRGNHRLRSCRKTDILTPSKMVNRRLSNVSDLSSQLEEMDYLHSSDAPYDGCSTQTASIGDISGIGGAGAQSLDLPSPTSDSVVFSEVMMKPMDMILVTGKTLFNKDPHLGIEYLQQQGALSSKPSVIAEFLSCEGLSRQAIGEYFGRLSDPLAVSVTEAFVKRLNLNQVEMDVALRLLLERVHPDGESQKIEFLLQVLKKCYIEQNQEKVAKEFHNPETIGVLAYSIMLLHTTFYNRNARRHGKPMTKVEFINNNRGIDNGQDISVQMLEGIYDRIAESEFKSMPDPILPLRMVDRLLSGPLKPENLIERHRRFVSWFSAFEVIDFVARRPLISRPTSQLRCLFLFNDLLVITKPLGMSRISVVDERLGSGSHRIRSIDRLVNRASNLAPLTTMSPLNVELIETPNSQRWHLRTSDLRLHYHYSTEVPSNGLFLIRQIIPLPNVKVLNFECEYYKYGVQLCDENSVLASISLPTGPARVKVIDQLNEAIWEWKEVVNFIAAANKKNQIPPESHASTSSKSLIL